MRYERPDGDYTYAYVIDGNNLMGVLVNTKDFDDAINLIDKRHEIGIIEDENIVKLCKWIIEKAYQQGWRGTKGKRFYE